MLEWAYILGVNVEYILYPSIMLWPVSHNTDWWSKGSVSLWSFTGNSPQHHQSGHILDSLTLVFLSLSVSFFIFLGLSLSLLCEGHKASEWIVWSDCLMKSLQSFIIYSIVIYCKWCSHHKTHIQIILNKIKLMNGVHCVQESFQDPKV